jgi:hypothetical protein
MHCDLQSADVFLDDDEVTRVLDWSEAGQGGACSASASTIATPHRAADPRATNLPASTPTRRRSSLRAAPAE